MIIDKYFSSLRNLSCHYVKKELLTFSITQKPRFKKTVLYGGGTVCIAEALPA